MAESTWRNDDRLKAFFKAIGFNINLASELTVTCRTDDLVGYTITTNRGEELCANAPFFPHASEVAKLLEYFGVVDIGRVAMPIDMYFPKEDRG